ncbi:MAG: hypothetical protein J4G09_10975 [Proteobacteria bacterium]|nr:hypothetical protein [Pseudomonadota bacterium]
MGSLACMLAGRGLRVTGSDTGAYPPMSEQLAAAGIEIRLGHSPENLLDPRPDLVVVGNAVRRDNPEARAAIDGGLPYVSFPDAVRQFFLSDRHPVVVTGTHGKTTTTSLIAWILTRAGRDPGALIGGVARNFGGSFRLGGGDCFVIEGDEYDTAFFDKTPKFWHYAAESVVLTSCEFDHADIYSSLEQIQAAFRKLLAGVPPGGRIVAATDAASVRAVLDSAAAPVEGYGFDPAALWRATELEFGPGGARFRVLRDGVGAARVDLPLHGRHNVSNALAAVAVCAGLGVEPETSAAALAEFAGVKRRQEVRGEAAGVVVIDDFAHHPTAVRETIAALRCAYPEHRLWAIFEPRTNTSRRRYFEAEFAEALAGADEVLLADVYRGEDLPAGERLRPERVAQGVRAAGGEASHLGTVEAIVERLVRGHRGRDVALIMSNGAFGGIWQKLLAELGGPPDDPE